MQGKARVPVKERGTAFIVIMLLIVITVVIVGTFLSTSQARVREVTQQVADASAYNAAESGLNVVVETLWITYRDAEPETRMHSLDGLDGSVDPDAQFVVSPTRLGRSLYRAEVRDIRVEEHEYIDVEIVATGENRYSSKTLRAVVRYGLKPAEVFDHAYFVNNFGWLDGGGITINGSVRANGNFSIKNAVVNGDVYAAENDEIGAAGTITGDERLDDLAYYNDHAPSQARPSDPSAPSEDLDGNGELDFGEDLNGNGELDTYEFKDGYDGSCEFHPYLPRINMPYLGNLTIYEDIAVKKGGTLSQGGTLLVDAVLGDQVTEDENLVLIGTEENPIVINGPVVIKNDVVLKGVISGQGTIYAGRNVHIIGDLRYKNPPSWPKPMYDADAVLEANKSKDMIGLAAKGSVILGDYTGDEWLAVTKKYQTTPFTTPYIVDPSDAANGYVSYYDEEGKPWFDGDYRADDGGLKDDGAGGKEARKFYESSFSDTYIQSISDEQVQWVDAVIYTNHLLSGKVGSTTFNGTLVCRDEAIVYNGSLWVNYDLRVAGGGYEFLDAYLPRSPSREIVYWGEGR
jgi:hypothetical protein